MDTTLPASGSLRILPNNSKSICVSFVRNFDDNICNIFAWSASIPTLLSIPTTLCASFSGSVRIILLIISS